MLPKYERPPVIETILGVQFEPVPKLQTAHLGAYWSTLGPEWPVTEDAAPLEGQFETFNDEAKWARVGLELKLARPQPRIRIRNRTNDRMIQVQNGRFIVNWLGGEGGVYPSYEAIRGDFIEQLRRFRDYLHQTVGEKLPTANQWEVTYLNHIPQGTVWNSPQEWHFWHLLRSPTVGLVELAWESAAHEWHFVIPPKRGRLHIAWQHGRREDGQEVIVLNLTARGACQSAELDERFVLEGLDIGHEAIVCTFRDFMSQEANQYWGLQDAAS